MAKIKEIDSDGFRNGLRKTIESSNINILLGAGFCYGITDTLGSTEKVLEIIGKYNEGQKYAIIEAYMFWDFFKRTIYPLYNKVDDSNLQSQIKFVEIWMNILRSRESAVNDKQANIFTTNYDVVLEYVFESIFIDYNDGFRGRINPYFSTSNFNRLYFENAIFTNRRAEIPIFNLLKLHGSVTWKIEKSGHHRIVYNEYKKNINGFYNKYKDFFELNTANIFSDLKSELDSLVKREEYTKSDLERILPQISDDKRHICVDFIADFKESFKIVSPTKQKFSDTLMDKNYYELMRIYSNELEKNNTVLIVQGFSFEDEHILEITLRALGNPSLTIIIFAYNRADVASYSKKFEKFQNVWIIKTPDISEEEGIGGNKETYLDLDYLNNRFVKLFEVFENEY